MISPGNKIYRSNAKLMISGEYLVLRGAEALAIPLKFGQSLNISEHNGRPSLFWKTLVQGQHWFDAIFSLDEFVIGNANDFPTAQNLRELLIAARKLQPDFLRKEVRYEAVSKLDFNINWGLGSSSSLIANIAKWAEIDPFRLFAMVSNGSGYDLATALSDKPVLYRLNAGSPEISYVDFYPSFRNKLYFAYLGKKRNSGNAVKSFNETAENDLENRIRDLNTITRSMISATELSSFRKLMRGHEKIISGILGVPPLSYKIMSDFQGDIKSLGAWGGDFIMLATDLPRDYVISWLHKKELNIWFAYDDIALTSNIAN